MKITHLIAVVMGTAALAATSAFAGPWDGNPELESSILNDLDRPAYVGTSLSDTRKRVYVHGTPNAVFPNHDIDETGYAVGTAGPDKGHGDAYGSILFDVDALH